MSALPIPGSSTPETPQDLLKTLRHEFDLADKLAKEVQAFREQAGIPAINEMRYAGYHLLHAMTSAVNTPHGELRKAINHCRRASYEAAEAGLLTALDQVRIFKDDYKGVTVSDVISNWIEILTDADAARDALTETRSKGDARHDDYELHMTNFRRIAKHCKALSYARDDMNTKVAAERSAGRQFTVTTVLAVLGILVAILLAVVVFPRLDMSGPSPTPPAIQSSELSAQAL